MFYNKPAAPKLEEEFAQLAQYWDPVTQEWTVKIQPGELYVSLEGGVISTVLGSCIAVCIRDCELGIGGMNHFMLPEPSHPESESFWGSNPATRESRYGSWAMEYLINGILKRGGQKEHLEVKVFGGGQMIAAMSDVGQRNILFAFNYLSNEGLDIKSSDVGDVFARKVLYFPQTGKVMMKKISSGRHDSLAQRDAAYKQQVSGTEGSVTSSDIDLF